MIDLHLHTTASDGRSTPDALAREAAAAGLTTMAVTDHDTVAAIPAAREAATREGLAFVSGIEVTAVLDGRDVHLLGYFIDERHAGLAAFLAAQRDDRRQRARAMVDRLRDAGAPIEIDLRATGAAAGGGRAIGRPLLAAALVAAGHARDIADAFDRFLSPGRPAFVARRGAPPADVIAEIVRAGGLVSLAHPGKTRVDDAIPDLVRAGLGAIEVFHPDHGDADRARYAALAAAHDLLVTGGSDYHGPGSGRASALGRVTLPDDAYRRLAERKPRP